MTVAEGGVEFGWRDFDTDPRGAVVTGRVTDFLGDRTVAYFLTTIEIPEGDASSSARSTIWRFG
jgi:hypothetical protein